MTGKEKGQQLHFSSADFQEGFRGSGGASDAEKKGTEDLTATRNYPHIYINVRVAAGGIFRDAKRKIFPGSSGISVGLFPRHKFI